MCDKLFNGNLLATLVGGIGNSISHRTLLRVINHTSEVGRCWMNSLNFPRNNSFAGTLVIVYVGGRRRKCKSPPVMDVLQSPGE